MKVTLSPPLRCAFNMAAREERYRYILLDILGSEKQCLDEHNKWHITHNPYSDWCAANNQAMNIVTSDLLPSERQLITATVEFGKR